MNHTQKQTHFKTFLAQWGDHFNKLPALEQFFQAYTGVVEEMEAIPIIKGHELEEYQLEWVSLVERFEHRLEKDFFKPWWVPISKNEYEYFLDLSAQPFRVFKVDFNGVEPEHWFMIEVIPDMSAFILGLEDGSVRLRFPTEDENGNPLDENGVPIISDTPSHPVPLPVPDPEWIGYDFLSIDYNMTGVLGHILESPIEERLITWFNYVPVSDNANKPYKAWWNIENKKFMLHLANAYIDKKQFYTRDIVPETEELLDDEFLYHFTSFSGTLTFVVDEIREPGYFSYDLKNGDKVFITINNGIVTLFDKNKA